MSLGNFFPVRSSQLNVQRFLVNAGTAESIKAGEPVIQDAGNTEYVAAAGANIDTDDTFVGIALTTSTDTATADGYVEVVLPNASTVFRGNAHTAANLASTQRLTKVPIVYDSSTLEYELHEDDTTKGFCQIVDYNSDAGTIDVIIDLTELLNA